LNITKHFVAGFRRCRARNGQAKRSSSVRSLAKLPQDFADLLIELREAGAEFLLVGGWAVILYGHVRATDDMDLADVEELERLEES